MYRYETKISIFQMKNLIKQKIEDNNPMKFDPIEDDPVQVDAIEVDPIEDDPASVLL